MLFLKTGGQAIKIAPNAEHPIRLPRHKTKGTYDILVGMCLRGNMVFDWDLDHQGVGLRKCKELVQNVNRGASLEHCIVPKKICQCNANRPEK